MIVGDPYIANYDGASISMIYCGINIDGDYTFELTNYISRAGNTKPPNWAPKATNTYWCYGSIPDNIIPDIKKIRDDKLIELGII